MGLGDLGKHCRVNVYGRRCTVGDRSREGAYAGLERVGKRHTAAKESEGRRVANRLGFRC